MGVDRLHEQAALVALQQARPGGARRAEITADVLEIGRALEVWHPRKPDRQRSRRLRRRLRKASDRGLAMAASVARALVARGISVIGGLALGIDTAPHRAALAAGGRTVAVVGTGINRVYPAENRELLRWVCGAGAARVSLLVVARWIQKDFGGNAGFLRELADHDYEPGICPWTSSICP